MSKINFEKRIVAFVDILGFKEHIKYLKKEEALIELLTFIKKINSSSKTHTLKLLGFEIRSKTFGAEESSITITVDSSSYSDHIIISAGSDSPKAFHAIIGMLSERLSWCQLFALSKGFALRGALSYGDMYFDTKNNIIFGKPLIEAIRDEEKLARYPRIIISQNLLEYIAERRNITLYDLYEHNNDFVGFRVDFDGLYYLDYFNFITNYVDLLKEVRSQIAHNIEDNMNNLSIASKWYWLANYFDLTIEIAQKNNSDNLCVEKFNIQH